MGLNAAAKNLMLDALATAADYVSLHDDDPSTDGSNEISGGSPAYARKAHTWNAASSGALDNSNAPEFDVPAGTTVKFVGLWSADTGGTFYGFFAVTNEAFAAQGKYTLTDADISLTDPA